MYLATEYCGQDLISCVSEDCGIDTGISTSIKDLVRQMVTAVADLHAIGIAHRDISLENFAVMADGTVKLIDLGQACFIQACDVAVVDFRGAPGKPQLLPPEILRAYLRPSCGAQC